ncbi:MAG: hypothetical protein KDI16_11175 [Halioglobus sp.]|nr:hypothetical protein [Halioglobus sp.]
MSKITIQDLSDSVELDRAAMSAILGGARTARAGLQQLQRQQQAPTALRLFDPARRRQPARHAAV